MHVITETFDKIMQTHTLASRKWRPWTDGVRNFFMFKRSLSG